ncbi:MAG: thioredoxin TrxC [Thiotrichales bacterium]
MAQASLEIVCPECGKTNRVPKQRLNDDARCGSCHQPLFNGNPLELDSNRLVRHIERDRIPLVVDFWAPWCGPCKMMAPAFAQAARDLEPGLRFAKVNTDAHPLAAEPFGIRSIPTLILFENGAERSRMSGAMNVTQLKAWLRQYIN